MAKKRDCCQPAAKEGKGVLSGILLGIVPHSVCIAFIVFSAIGATVAVGFMRDLLLLPYLFPLLVLISLAFATLAAVLYLRRSGEISWAGVARRRGYLATLYATTIGVNLLLFMVVLPLAANLDAGGTAYAASTAGSLGSEPAAPSSEVRLQVDIPCPGHAPLIMGELRNLGGIQRVVYAFPNVFDVWYNDTSLSVGDIVSLEVFETYKARVIRR